MDNRTPPPPYSQPVAALTHRVQPRSLRIVVVSFSLAGAIWAAVWGGNHLVALGRERESSQMKIFDALLGVLYLVCAVIELGGLMAAWKNAARPIRLYCFASLLTVTLVAAGGIISIVSDLVTKADLISNCTTAYTGEVSYGGWWGSGSGGSETWTKEQAEAYCKKAWNKTVWYDAFWLVAAVFFASFATMFSFAFSRQLANPNAFLANSSTVNSHNPMHNRNPSSTAVPLQPYPSQNAPDYVPPYPGPPPSSSPHAPSSDTKAGYVPHTAEDEAWNRSLQDSERREWEQHRLNQQDHDADDHGVFVGRSGGGGGMRSHEEEEAAWEEARRTASTAGGSLNNPFRSRQESEAEDERKGGVV